MKSALSTLMRMVARKPVSSRTVTQELMMENQWICGQESQGETQPATTTCLSANVGEQVVLVLSGAVLEDLLHLPNEAPHRQVIVIHLKVPVLLDSLVGEQ